MLKFSNANAKIEALKNDDELSEYLTDKRKVYSLDLLSGYSCPFAQACLSKAAFASAALSSLSDIVLQNAASSKNPLSVRT